MCVRNMCVTRWLNNVFSSFQSSQLVFFVCVCCMAFRGLHRHKKKFSLFISHFYFHVLYTVLIFFAVSYSSPLLLLLHTLVRHIEEQASSTGISRRDINIQETFPVLIGILYVFFSSQE